MTAFMKQTISLMSTRTAGELLERILYKVTKNYCFTWCCYQHFYIFAYDLTKPLAADPPASLAVRRGTPGDLPRMKAIYAKPEGEFEKRFSLGHDCFLAEMDGKLAGMMWVERGDLHYEPFYEFRFPLPPGSVWAYDSFIAPEYRGAGIWRHIVLTAGRQLRETGIRTIYCHSDRMNKGSVIAHLKIGYGLALEVLFLRFFSLRLYRERKTTAAGEAGPWETTGRLSRKILVPKSTLWGSAG